MSTESLTNQIMEALSGIRTVDCHSHTRLRHVYYASGGFDLFSLMDYFGRDLAAMAGNSLYQGADTDEERWQRLKAALAKARNVSYWRHNILVYRKLYNLEEDELNDSNWQRLNAAIRAKSQDPGWYDWVTRDVCNLETQVRNIPWFEDWEPEYFTGVLRMEPALMLHEEATRQNLERHLNVGITDLADAKDALVQLTEEYTAKGAVGIKLAHAYTRTLHSVSVPESRAASIFAKALGGMPLGSAELKDLQDHIIFFLAELAQDKDLVFQIHTGVQDNWGNIPDSDPLLLIPLLKAFPQVRFDLFHTGYPYARMLGMLGKHFPNVWLNMAWMYIVSIAASRQILSEWIDLVPGYRILGFGSDVHFPEMIIGHLDMARSCVAGVLADKVREDFLSEEEAFCLAHKMFCDNGLELYGLSRRSQGA